MQEKIYLKNGEGLNLCGILNESDKSGGRCIILCHGITVDKDESGDSFVHLASELVKKGFAVFRFDFRGHGESEGRSLDLTVSGEIDDLQSAVLFLRNRGYERFGIVAASFGGGAASLFSSRNSDQVKALVLWNAIIDYDSLLNPRLPWPTKYFGETALLKLKRDGSIEIGSRGFAISEIFFQDLKELRPWKELRKIHIPILFLHGDKDTYVPYEDSVKYSEMLGAEMKTIPGAEHGLCNNESVAKEAREAVTTFFLNNIK